MFERFINMWLKPANKVTMKLVFSSQYMQLPNMLNQQFIANQSALSESYDWYANKRTIDTEMFEKGGHFALTHENRFGTQLWLQSLETWLEGEKLPVMISNCHDTININIEPIAKKGSVGVISIGRDFHMSVDSKLQTGSAYYRALSKYDQLLFLGLGIDEDKLNASELEFVEDMNCYWLTKSECNLRYRHQIKEQLYSFGAKVEQLVIDIDLASIIAHYRNQTTVGIDLPWLVQVIRYCISSGKLKLVQLVGDREYLVYSKQVLTLLETMLTSDVPTVQSEWPLIAPPLAR